MGYWKTNNTLIANGRYEINYILEGQTAKPVFFYMERYPTSSKMTFFFQDWDVGDLTGAKWLTFDEIYGRPKTWCGWFDGSDNGLLFQGWVGMYPYPNPKIFGESGIEFKVTHASVIEWENHLTVYKLPSNPSNPIGGYSVNLLREFNDKYSRSKIDIYNNDKLLYTSNTKTNINDLWYSEITCINITSPTYAVYSFPIIEGSEISDEAVKIYVRDAQTGDLISGAHLTIIDGITGTAIVNEVLPTGQKVYALEKSPSLRYSAQATAEGYTSFGSTQFGVGDHPLPLVLWMYPDAPAIEPPVEGKTALYGYLITQGSQQPIPGATVSLDGHGSTTTSSTGFYLFNDIDPVTATISASAPDHDPLTEQVTVDTAPTQHNLALIGHYTLKVTVKDADSLATITNATTISLSDGQELNDQNPATFPVDYGTYSITTAAEGHYPTSQYQYIDKPGETQATILLTPKAAPTPAPEYPNYPPHNVKFTVQTIFGAPVPDVNVTAQGIQQTPSPNVLERLLGLNTTSTPITTELMAGTTDTAGNINFMMIEAVKYRVNFYKPDIINQTIEIYPKDDNYPIIISSTGGPLLPEAGDPLKTINVTVTTSTTDDTGHITVDYDDATRKTTALSIAVSQQNGTAEEVVASHTVANDANVTHTFDIADSKGNSYFVRIEATHPDYGTVLRDFSVRFKAPRVPLGNLPDELYVYVAGFLLLLIGGIFTASSATKGVIVVAFSGWLFYAFGWLDSLGLTAPITLGLVSVFAVLGVIVSRYREEGYT